MNDTGVVILIGLTAIATLSFIWGLTKENENEKLKTELKQLGFALIEYQKKDRRLAEEKLKVKKEIEELEEKA